MQLQIQPPLAVNSGDTILVKLDGKQLTQGYDRIEIHVSAKDWARAANPGSIEHRLQVAIADRTGAMLVESTPIRFYAHRASVHPRAR